MSRRNRLQGAALAMLGVSLCNAAGAAPRIFEPPAYAPLRRALLSQRFRFNAGAPLVAPAGVSEMGNVCVGTSDGYVHLLAPDGAYRWSFTVRGAVTRRPLFVAGHWLVVTSTDRVYALTPEGSLSWVFHPPAGVASELAASPGGPAFFVGADEFLYGLSGHGGVVFRAPFGQLAAGPELAETGVIWAQNKAGAQIRVQGIELTRFAPDAAPRFEFGLPDRRPAPDGSVWQTLDNGSLELLLENGERRGSLAVAHSPLLSARYCERERELVVSAREGLVVAVRVALATEH